MRGKIWRSFGGGDLERHLCEHRVCRAFSGLLNNQSTEIGEDRHWVTGIIPNEYAGGGERIWWMRTGLHNERCIGRRCKVMDGVR